MKAYKGFDKDLKCRDFQYEVGKEYEEEDAELCASGFHACENPLDVLDYYPLVDKDANSNRFGEVDLDAADEKKGDDSKRCGKKIKIVAEIGIKGIIQATVEFFFASNEATKIGKDTKEVSKELNSKLAAAGDDSKLVASGYRPHLASSGDRSLLAAAGNRSHLAASGDDSHLAAAGDRSLLAAAGDDSHLAASGYNSQLAASGDDSKLAASGDDSHLAAAGDRSQLAASGDDSHLAASGYNSQLAASGDDSKLAASGDGSKLAASGYGSKLAASGDGSKLAASGDGSVVMNAGIDGTAKASKGCWITLAEWEIKDEKRVPVAVVTKQVDGVKVKADTWYCLECGKFKAV